MQGPLLESGEERNLNSAKYPLPLDGPALPTLEYIGESPFSLLLHVLFIWGHSPYCSIFGFVHMAPWVLKSPEKFSQLFRYFCHADCVGHNEGF